MTKKIILVLSALAGLSTLAVAEPPDRGPIPDEAFREGSVDLGRIPDYVETCDRDGKVVGYANKYEIFGHQAEKHLVPVLDGDNLDHLVGHMVPGEGFVALSELGQASVPASQ